ncbi:MAG TPA: ATP-binding protein [Alphaproteobacteria bacterium]|nr:ATP-binding protein [Alphaproteobacteria bacterium]
MSAEAFDSTVLILAPSGRDGAVAASVLRAAGIVGEACPDATALAAGIGAGAGAAVVAEEALDPRGLQALRDAVAAQPPWSDFPIVVLTTGGERESGPPESVLRALGNVTLLERPLHMTTLVKAVESALRARRRQHEIRRINEELERRVETAVAERETAQAALLQAQKLEAIGQLTGGVAHDFNNLLTAVLGNVELLARRTQDERHRRLLQATAQAARRGATLTGQLLAFARRQHLMPKPSDLNGIVLGMAALLSRSVGPLATVETRLAPDLWEAVADPHHVEHAILNLALNARDAMPNGGTVTIATRNAPGGAGRPADCPPGDYVAVAVSDTGIGMTPEVARRAVEPFFTTKETGKGSGLGLSMVYGLARQLGGGVAIDTAPGRGSTVAIFLPRAQASRDARPAARDRAMPAAGTTLLVVDDDEDVREFVVATLESLGYRVLQARDGRLGQEALQAHPEIGLMLVDFAMPGMTGADLARLARDQRPDLPILFMTGYSDTDGLQGLATEETLLRKPFRVDDLEDKLATALQSARPRPRLAVSNDQAAKPAG